MASPDEPPNPIAWDPYGDDFDEEEFLAAWDAAEADAVELLREALADHIGDDPPLEALAAAAARLRTGMREGSWPFRYIRRAGGFKSNLPADDLELWMGAAGSLMSMQNDSGMGSEADAAIMALQHADWLGAIVGLVRAGVGASAEPEDLVRYINDCDEVEVEGDVDPEDDVHIEHAFELVLPTWEAAGAVDESRRLTPLGRWGLPRALATAWTGDFDALPGERDP